MASSNSSPTQEEREKFYAAWGNLIRAGSHHPYEDRFFAGLLKHHRAQTKEGIQKFYTEHPKAASGIARDPELATSAELEAFKVSERRFEDQMDALKLETGADVRTLSGYQTIRDWFTRGIADLEGFLQTLKAGAKASEPANPKAWSKPMTQTALAQKLRITAPTLRKRLKADPQYQKAIRQEGRGFQILNGMIPVLREKLTKN